MLPYFSSIGFYLNIWESYKKKNTKTKHLTGFNSLFHTHTHKNKPDLSSWKIKVSPSVLDAAPSDWLSLWEKQVVTARLVGKHWWPQWVRERSAAPCPFNCDRLTVGQHWHKHGGGTTSPLRISHLVRGGGGKLHRKLQKECFSPKVVSRKCGGTFWASQPHFGGSFNETRRLAHK